MASESDLSSHVSDGDEDSDTIVISSKSRILISPRKKGSKAVSRLLGSAAAADDIVESIIRGSSDSADVQVVRKEKKATVRVGGATQELRNGTTSTTASTAHHTSTKASHTTAHNSNVDSRHERHVHSARTTAHRTRHPATMDDVNSLGSSVESELSEPSSGDESPVRVKQTNSTKATARTKTTAVSSRTRSAQHDQTYDDIGSESDADEADYESDASSFTKDSSRSDVQYTHNEKRHSKFDDQLRPATESSRPRQQQTRESTKHSVKHTKTRPRQAASSSELDDSVVLPKTATQEMEDLKQTLKNLAHQEPAVAVTKSSSVSNSTFTLSNVPKKAHTGTRREEYAAPAMTTQRHSDAAWAVATAHKSSTHHSSSRTKASRPVSHSDDDSESDVERGEPTVARRLFSTPPSKSTKSSVGFSTPPTVPISVARTTPSPRSSSFPSASSTGYTSVLDTSLTTAAASSAQGSRAVLSALKALQDKIRRLEEERERLLQDLSDAKVKARKREAEFASAEKKFAYELGQTKESARAAYDALRSEKEELKLELVKYEERRKAAEAEIQHAHKLTTTYSAKADDLQSQLHSSESQRKSIHAELDATSSAHKQELRDLRGEMMALQKDVQITQEQTKLVQSQLDRELQSHNETRERLHEAEQTVAGITQLNEKLVAKVWEANEIATKATKKSKKLLQTQRVSTLSRPTAASRAASISGVNGSATPGRPGSATVPKGRSGSIVTKRVGSVKKEKRASQVPATNNLELLRAANMGRDIPFVLGTSANRSHSIISNVQEAIRQCDTTYARPVTNPPPTPTHLKSKKSSKKPSSVRGEPAYPATTASSAASILGLALNHHRSQSTSSDTLLGARSRSRDDSGSAQPASSRPSAIRVPTPSTSYANPMQSQIMEDLDAAVRTAEHEFQTLNRRYKDAVARVEKGKEGASKLSTELGGMLDELEAKGKQLNLLKQVYEQAARSTINPIRHIVHSPEAVRRKTASLRILSDYRQMERDAKSPRSAATTPGMPASPTGTNNTSRRASFFSDNED